MWYINLEDDEFILQWTVEVSSRLNYGSVFLLLTMNSM